MFLPEAEVIFSGSAEQASGLLSSEETLVCVCLS